MDKAHNDKALDEPWLGCVYGLSFWHWVMTLEESRPSKEPSIICDSWRAHSIHRVRSSSTSQPIFLSIVSRAATESQLETTPFRPLYLISTMSLISQTATLACLDIVRALNIVTVVERPVGKIAVALFGSGSSQSLLVPMVMICVLGYAVSDLPSVSLKYLPQDPLPCAQSSEMRIGTETCR